MAKVHITTKEGALITIEGTPAEVATITEKLSRATAPSLHKGSKHRQSKLKPTPMGLLGSLIDGNFFRKPKDLAAVKVALEEMGHVYPMTTLSPILLRLVRKRQLRRIKEKNRWLYVG
jgi:hypothetical protein